MGPKHELERHYDVILVDAQNLCSRVWFTTRNLYYNGRPTGLIYSMLRWVLGRMARHPDAQIIFLWEGGPLKRKELSASYKQGRKQTRGNTYWGQMDPVREVLAKTPVWQAVCPGYEADDLAAVYVKHYLQDKKTVLLLVSTDRDWWPLAGPRVDVLVGQDVYVPEALEKKFAMTEDMQGTIPLSRIYLWKSLVGDKSDKISGLSRVPHALVERAVREVPDLKRVPDYFRAQGESTWAERAALAMPELMLNYQLVSPSYVPVDEIKVTEGSFDMAGLKRAITKYGLHSLERQLTTLVLSA